MSAIEVKNLKKYFGRVKAVDGASFDVKKGEIFGFLGPNGAGKTTTIRCLMDFLRPTSGTIKILGHDAQSESTIVKKHIGYLAPDVKLYGSLNGREHFALSEAISGKSKILNDLIAKLNFNPKVKFKNLSTGNQQKLGLILAMMHEPELLILDEPTTGLDPILQNTIHDILRELNKNGSTVFFSSHNLAEVEKICTRVGIIKQGKLVGSETISGIKTKKIYSIYVDFVKKPDLHNLATGTTEITKESLSGYIFKVRGNIAPVLKKLSEYEIKDIEITHATLEDIFLEFYD